jgi:hypothetical protein
MLNVVGRLFPTLAGGGYWPGAPACLGTPGGPSEVHADIYGQVIVVTLRELPFVRFTLAQCPSGA